MTSCSENAESPSLRITKCFQAGDLACIRDEFYSDSLFKSIKDVDKIIKNYQEIIGDLKMDKEENFNTDTFRSALPPKYFKQDSANIVTTVIPLNIVMPSPVPSHLLVLYYLVSV